MRSRLGLVAVLVALFLLTVTNIWLAPDFELERSETSFGVERWGYKAAFDLLTELGFGVSRGYDAPSRLSRNRPVWFVEPAFLDPAHEEGEKEAAELQEWVRSGGTAVVFGDSRSVWKRLDITASDPSPSCGEDGITVAIGAVSGPLAASPRRVPSLRLSFEPPTEGDRRISLSFGRPLALEIAEGAGRLIAVADSAFLRNVNLPQADSSLLVTDLVRSLGVPVFDERSHGFAPPVSFFGTFVRSRAVWGIAFGLVALVCWIGERRVWPRRMLAEEGEGPVPSVTSFIESLGTIYSRVSDHASVFRAYRTGFLRRLKRQMSPRRRELPDDLLLARLRAEPALSPETRRWLVDGALPDSEHVLLAAVRAIEALPRGTR